MSSLSRPFLVSTIAALLLILACTTSNAASDRRRPHTAPSALFASRTDQQVRQAVKCRHSPTRRSDARHST